MRRMVAIVAALCMVMAGLEVITIPPTASAISAPAVVGASNALPKSVAKPAKPTTASVRPTAPAPVGSAARRLYDTVQAAKTEAKNRGMAQHTPMKVVPPRQAATASAVPAPALSKMATSRLMATPADACSPSPGEQWYAQYSPGAVEVSPSNNASGTIDVTLNNDGTATWPAGSTYLGYHLYDANGNAVSGTFPKTPLNGAVPSGSTQMVRATVAPLSPAIWRIAWDVWVDGLGWFSDNGVCAVTVQYVIPDQPPNITLATPPNQGTVTTRTPSLFVNGSDPDAWPGSPLTYQFTVCKDAAFTQNCINSAWSTSSGYTIPAGYVDWNGTFYWTARVSDGDLTTDPLRTGQGGNQVTVAVPVPDVWRTVGQGLGLATVDNVVMPYGIWVRTETDAQIPTAGLPLRVQRTYSSGAQGYVGAFGAGWLSMFDAQAEWTANNSVLEITYPDGRQENFGLNSSGALVSTASSGATDAVTQNADGSLTVKDANQEVLSYNASGQLTQIADSAGDSSLSFTRDTGGRILSITQQPSTRTLSVSWTAPVAANTNGCTAAMPPLVSEIDAPPPASGQSPLKWTYQYTCAQLTKQCDATNACATYSATPTSGYRNDPYFETTPAGVTIDTLENMGSYSGDTGYTQVAYNLPLPSGATRLITIYQLSPDATTYQANDYSVWNQYMGPIVEWYDYVLIDGSTPNVADRPTLYLFDDQYRLRDQAKRLLRDSTTTGVDRSWVYGYVTGQFWTFLDENLNGFSVGFDGWGNYSSKLGNIDPNTQYGSDNGYYDSQRSGNHTRVTNQSVWPLQTPEDTGRQNFYYDDQGRLTERDGYPTPGAPNGQQTNYTYTTSNVSPAVGGWHGGTPPVQPPPNGIVYMPPGLVHTVTTSAGTTTYSYDPNGDLTQVVDPLGKRTAYDYDDDGRRISQTEYSDSFPGGVVTQYVYDGDSRLVRQIASPTTNQVTGVTSQLRICTEYNGDSQPTRVIQTAASACPAPGSAAAPGSRVTTYEYGPDGRIDQVVDPVGGAVTYVYIEPGLDQGGITYWGLDAGPDEDTVHVVDQRGRVIDYGYDRGHLIDEWGYVGAPPAAPGRPRATYQQLLAVTLDPAGRPIQTSDALGRNTAISWTQNDLESGTTVLAVGQPDGTSHNVPVSTETYDGAGDVTTRTVGGSQVTQTTFDLEGHPIDVVVDPAGLNRDTHATYDAAGRLVGTSLSDGSRTESVTSSLDANGNVVTQSVNDGSTQLVTDYTRDQRGLPIGVTDPRGAATGNAPAYTTNSTYNELGLLTSTTAPPVTVEQQGSQPTTERPQTVYGYDVFGDLTDVRDPNGNITHVDYDAASRPVETDEPAYTPPGSSATLHPVIKRTYDKAGDLTSLTDPNGNTTNYEYDYAGNVITKTGPTLNGTRPVTHYTYDADNELTGVTDPTGAVTNYDYDAMGRLVAATQTVGGVALVTSYAYDDASNLISVTSPSSLVTRYDYDKTGERIATHLPGITNPTTTAYDVAGRVIKQTDPSGRATTTTYDLAGRATQVQHLAPDGSVVDTSTTEYDAADNIVARTSPNGARNTDTVDALNHLTALTTPLTATTSTTSTAGFDAAGNQARSTDGNGNTTWTTYNSLGLPETLTDPPTTAYPNAPDGRWTTTYDANGQPVGQTQPGGVSVTATYDPFGDVTSVHGTGAGDVTLNYGYDLNSRLTSFTTTGGTQSVGYNEAGQVSTSSGPAGSVTYGYNADGQMVSRQDAAGSMPSTYGYTNGQLTSTIDALTGKASNAQYDPASGQLTSTNLPNGASTGYSYDNRGRTAAITVKDPTGTVLSNTTYGYDPDSDVSSEQVTGAAAQPSGGTYAYDLADRLTGWTPQDGTLAHTYTYDAAGNRTGDQTTAATTTWSYDSRNQLTASGATTYGYTARGTLASTVHGSTTIPTSFDSLSRMVSDAGQTYSYDAMGRLATHNSADFAYDGLESTPVITPGQTDALSPSGTVLTANIGNATVAPTTNVHGDITGWQPTSTTGGLAGVAGYDPFGQPVHTNGTQSSLGYQSEYTDPATGMVDMAARWYAPATADFTSRDSVDQGLTGPASMDSYAYANDNPITDSDPTGHFAWAALLGDALDIGALADPIGWLVVGGLVVGGAIQFGPQIMNAIGSTFSGTTAIPGAAVATPSVARATTGDQVQTTEDVGAPTVAQPAATAPTISDVLTSTWTSAPWAVSGVTFTGTTRTEWTQEWERVWQQITNLWSNGKAFKSPVTDWLQMLGETDVTVQTLDPSRLWGTISAGQLATAGTVTATQAAVAGSAGVCGLTGTLVSCLAASKTTPIGGGCAGLAATEQACVMSEPEPGDSRPVREASDTNDPSSGPESPRGPPGDTVDSAGGQTPLSPDSTNADLNAANAQDTAGPGGREGEATVYLDHGTDPFHASVRVDYRGESLHSEQEGTIGTDAVGKFFEGEPVDPIKIRIPLPDAAKAQAFQRATEDYVFGPYDLETQSCVTYCGDVLKAGGVEGIPENSSDILRWLFRNDR